MTTDGDTAQKPEPIRIEDLADQIGLLREEVEPYGRYKAKVALTVTDRPESDPMSGSSAPPDERRPSAPSVDLRANRPDQHDHQP